MQAELETMQARAEVKWLRAGLEEAEGDFDE